MDELTRIFIEAERCSAEGKQAAMVTLVRAEGSAFRRAGARMLVSESSSLAGAVSGGCLDADLSEHASRVMASGVGRVVVYKPEDHDPIFGLGSGCDGLLELLIEPLTGELLEGLRLANELRAHEPVIAVCRYRNGEAGTRFFRQSDELSEPAGGALVETIQPVVSLLLFGAGPVMPPLAHFARLLGWRVIVADHRRAQVSAERFPDADQIIVSPAEELPAACLTLGSRCVAVVGSHHWAFDAAVLPPLLAAGLPYVGLIGARSRKDRLVSALQIPPGQLSSLHAPAGLATGGENPGEIALAIAAEIQTVLNGTRAIALREASGPVHSRSDSGTALVILAAGGSSRYGSSKQLAKFGSTTLIRHAAETALRSQASRVFVVVGSRSAEVRNELDGLDVVILENPDWQSGIASSIRRAMTDIASGSKPYGAVLLTLGDQPLITSVHLDAIMARPREGASIVASRYPDGAGAPALFTAQLFEVLATLEGDTGAKELIRKMSEATVLVDIPTDDADRPVDLQTLNARCSNR